MKVTTLKTVGDGFANNHYWPMWSQILSEILCCKWVHYSLPGLGNEAISNIVLDELSHDNDPGTLWVIQWAAPPRLDLEINNHNRSVTGKIAQDPTYPNNYITTKSNRTYWSSSASKLDFVDTYRNLITPEQQHTRSMQHAMATTLALEKSNCAWKYIFTYDAPWINNTWIPAENIVEHSLQSFLHTSQYRDLDIGEIQPVSSVHLEFLEKYILTELVYDIDNFNKLRAHYIQQDQHRKSIPGFNPRHINPPTQS